MYRATHNSSPAEIPTAGPTWNSHCFTPAHHSHFYRKNLWGSISQQKKKKNSGVGRQKERKKEKEYSLNWAHLARHNFPINSTDVNSSIEAGLIVWIHYITTKCLVCPYTTIVGTLHGYKNRKYKFLRLISRIFIRMNQKFSLGLKHHGWQFVINCLVPTHLIKQISFSIVIR